MNKSFLKFVADFGPLLIFFTIYYKSGNNLSVAIPPLIIATIIAVVIIYILEKKSKIRSYFEKTKETLIVPFYEDTPQTLLSIAKKILIENFVTAFSLTITNLVQGKTETSVLSEKYMPCLIKY